MPNSLRCKIKHLCHNGTLTERERDRILKALEQEPKTGHWELYHKDADTNEFKCSQCGAIYCTDYDCRGSEYCPDCGARMESEVAECH